MDIIELEDLAKANDWQYLTFQEDIGMLSFVKDDMRINIYTTKMTVATCLNHPKQGKTQMFRKNVTPQEMEKIFKNPRHHINKGYKRK
jgi:hypothetical protein